ncbi:MAG TPA: hypothetical protein VKB54_10450 [Solirubrobacteraceae bacterium]|nr:hypothetical protein [Solirubrobacteraceae bacterium]
MTTDAPLTPHAALGWLRSLSVDLEAIAILDASGAVLAGDHGLTPEDHGVLAARSERFAIVVRPGPQAIPRLVGLDLRAALNALETA